MDREAKDCYGHLFFGQAYMYYRIFLLGGKRFWRSVVYGLIDLKHLLHFVEINLFL